ncbi:MAG: DUF1360 domain-containing protein [Gaiellaceae bacterium]
MTEAGETGVARPLRRIVWPGSETTPLGPSGPEDYALLNIVYLSGLSALAAVAHRLGPRAGDRAIPLREVPLLSGAAFALAHVLAKEKISTWLREPFVVESGERRPLRSEGEGLRYAIGELLTCTRCVGAWCALGLVGLRTASPPAGRLVSTVLATAGVNNVAQAAFRLLVEKTNLAEIEAKTVAAAAAE